MSKQTTQPITYQFDAQCDQYAVMGNPIKHSRSPQIHKAFADQTGEKLHYSAIEVPEGHFAEAVHAFRAAGGKGVNITVPFKEEAWALCDHRTEQAELAGAVNTIWFDGDEIHGANTDGIGLLRDITENHTSSVMGKRILILGAGGAVRGVIKPFLDEKPASCVIANRTLSKAEALQALFSDYGPVSAVSFADLAGQSFDIVINGTSASLHGALPELPDDLLAESAMSYDMMYAKEPTPFVNWGLLHGAKKSVDGLGMLVEQAAEAFYLWRGIRPLTKVVITDLKT